MTDLSARAAVQGPAAASPPTPKPPTRKSRSGKPSRWLRFFERTWLIVVLFAVWWFASAASTNLFIPPLEKILVQLGKDFANGLIVDGMLYSLTNLASGLAIAIVVGIIGGIVLGETKLLADVLDPVIHFFRSVPQAALVPLIIGAFGLGQGPKIYTIAFACVWPILLNTMDGVRGGEPTVRRFAKVYRIPPMLYFRRVALPGAMPQIVAGVRVALPIGITVMVVSELFATNRGLGHYILNSSSTFQIPATWAGALLVGVIGYILSLLFTLAERRILRWYFKSAASN